MVNHHYLDQTRLALGVVVFCHKPKEKQCYHTITYHGQIGSLDFFPLFPLPGEGLYFITDFPASSPLLLLVLNGERQISVGTVGPQPDARMNA